MQVQGIAGESGKEEKMNERGNRRKRE